jgi:hypothetical protein
VIRGGNPKNRLVASTIFLTPSYVLTNLYVSAPFVEKGLEMDQNWVGVEIGVTAPWRQAAD